MVRKLNTKNLYKLVERIVLSIAVLAIIYFIYLWNTEEAVMSAYIAGIYSCPNGLESCYTIWHDYLSNYRAAQMYSAFFGFVLPILFFVGRMIVNYVFPVEKKLN